MNKLNRLLAAMPLLLVLLVPLPAMSDEHDAEQLAEVWVVNSKPGKANDLEQAVKAHQAHRKELGDPRQWRIYSPVLGKNLDQLIIRSFGFGWADMDAYRAWSEEKNPLAHWSEHADPHVASYEHYISVLDTKNSNWGPEVKYRYVDVNSYVIKPGHRQAVMEDVKALSDAAKAAKWPYNWTWGTGQSGRQNLYVAVAYKDYASMAPPETKFADMLAKQLGSEDEAKALLERWVSHFESIHSSLYVLREDLMQ